MNNFYQCLQWMGTLINKILNIQTPWFELTFGQIFIGIVFFGFLIGVITNILTSISNGGNGRIDK